MKKVLLSILLLALCLSANLASAAGTCSVSSDDYGMMRKLTYTCTADASDGSFPSTASLPQFGWVLRIDVVPGATNPTSGWAATLKDSSGIDITNGGIVSLSESTASAVKLDGARGWTRGTLTLAVTGNSVNSAQLTFLVWIYREP